jgi:hypothetical protein
VTKTDRDSVVHFLQQIHSYVAPYGGGVNSSKTRSLILLHLLLSPGLILMSVLKVVGGEFTSPNPFPLRFSGVDFCSIQPPSRLSISTPELTNHKIRPCFSRLLERPIHHSINRDCLQNGISLRKVMKRFLKPKCHSIIVVFLLSNLSRTY